MRRTLRTIAINVALAIPCAASTIPFSFSSADPGQIMWAPAEGLPAKAPVQLIPDPAWDPTVTWIGYYQTGSGGIVEPNGFEIQDFDFVTFTGDVLSGTLTAFGDDVLCVAMDNMNCLPGTSFNFATGHGITVDLAGIPAGSHQFMFLDRQEGGYASGLAFRASGIENSAPEPASCFLIGAGLLVVGLRRRGR